MDEEHGPAISGESETHVMNGRLEVAQITVLGQGQEFRARRNRHPRQELVRVVFPLLHDQLPLDLLELPQQYQAGDHVRRHHVQIAKEIAEQPGDIRERILRTEAILFYK